MRKFLSIILLLTTLVSCTGTYDRLQKGFAAPPSENKPRVWWHWEDGNVTKEGIRADLEWMDRIGIGGFHHFDAALSINPVVDKRLVYMDEGWQDAFRYAIALADSLGLSAGIASSPGWSSTGGPWVSEDDAMKQLIWSATDVPEGHFCDTLPQPKSKFAFYRDIVTLAFPLGEEDDSVRSITVLGNSRRGRWAISPEEYNLILEAGELKEVCRIPTTSAESISINIPPTSASKDFRLRDEAGRSVPEFILYSRPRIERAEEKAGFASPYNLNEHPTAGYAMAFAEPQSTIDLTEYVDESGRLDWNVPEGRWRILRFGYTLTGKKNGPAPAEATGLEVDKLDPDAWSRYFHNYLDMYRSATGGLFGKRGITELLVDSYEAWWQTWTPAMAREFKARRGYDLLPWMPVLSGEIIGSPAQSERFLFDWRRTIAELYADNYARIKDFAREYGLKDIYLESQENGRVYLADGMDVKKSASVPMAACWMPVPFKTSHSTTPMAIADMRESSSVAHLYGKRFVAAESFTADGTEMMAYAYTPELLKRVADTEFASGVNRIYIHESSHQPLDDCKPGLGLLKYGQWFTRHETWAEQARAWMDYLARTSFLLSQGSNVADVLVYYGEDTNITARYGAHSFEVPAGYNFDFINPSGLFDLKVRSGAIVAPSGARYRVLCLDCEGLPQSEEVCAEIARLIAAGAVVCTASQLEEVLPALVDADVRGECPAVGPGADVHGECPAVGSDADVHGECPAVGPGADGRCCDTLRDSLRFVHRALRGADIYWINNPLDVRQNVNLSFRSEDGRRRSCCSSSREAFCFDPVSGEITPLACDGTGVQLSLEAFDARFVVFAHRTFGAGAKLFALSAKKGESEAKTSSTASGNNSVKEGVRSVASLNAWTLSIAGHEFTLDSLVDYSAFPYEEVKYFSGTACYRTRFELEDIPSGVSIDLGRVCDIAELSVNGQDAGILWRSPFKARISNLLHEGTNEICVKVTNTWVNRLIGDEQSSCPSRSTYTSHKFYTADSPLLPSGLLGPVILETRGQQAFKGWPSHETYTDLKAVFANPPKGYGNVPFYWWNGDSLNIDRLREQLDILSEASVDGLCISYHHTHKDVEKELNAPGHGPCGRVSGGEPRVFSEEWWAVLDEYAGLCADKGIGIGMDDYVVAWPKNGEFIDSILAEPSIRDYQGQLVRVKLARTDTRPANVLHRSKAGRDSVVYICTEPAPWLHPELGKRIVEEYFDPFYEHLGEQGRSALNYFFQDELQYGLNLRSWSEDMQHEFISRKGYDVVPHLDALFIEDPELIDRRAARVRLDYAEVLTQLAEERYFAPTYSWNADKGLIYGCDPEGRGKRPLQYLDYFRAISWFTAPGNDAPSRGSSFLQTKVSSSIAHLYDRPRTWLEAFHSMGWDANGALLTHQLDHHLIAGGNLLCMHGLYYSTHGGWWEWAPPCFHFRMPYWPHMKLWLRYAERMCFLLSQGTHVCDVAILYPTETMQAVPGAKATLTFAAADSLSKHGIDFDFIDYQSLQKAGREGSRLQIGDESYSVLVLCDAKAMHKETRRAIGKFRRSGGVVISLDESASGLVEAVRGAIEPDFYSTSGQGRVLHRHIDGRDVYMVMDVPQGDSVHFRAFGNVERWNAMDGSTSAVRILGCDEAGTWLCFDEPTGNSALYVFSSEDDASASTEMPLAGGKTGTSAPKTAELLTAGGKTGTSAPQTAELLTAGGKTGLSAPAEQGRAGVEIGGEWQVEIIPTLNNRWGDFRLPASDEYIGVEARVFECTAPDGTRTECCYGYGPQMETCTIPASASLDSLLAICLSVKSRKTTKGGNGPDALNWEPYIWSWQYGVPDSPGSQGWHGLKARIDPCFLILDRGGHQLFRTRFFAPANGNYVLRSDGIPAYRVLVDGEARDAGKDCQSATDIFLTAGWHELLVAYANTQATPYELRKKRGEWLDKRDRAMITIWPATGFFGTDVRDNAGRDGQTACSAPGPQEHGPYDSIVASAWYGSTALKYHLANGRWSYAFETAPGTTAMSFEAHGKVCSITVDGHRVGFVQEGTRVSITSGIFNPRVVPVVITAIPETGFGGGAFFETPVKMECHNALMSAGDWSRCGALAFFSGAIRYTKTITIDSAAGADDTPIALPGSSRMDSAAGTLPDTSCADLAAEASVGTSCADLAAEASVGTSCGTDSSRIILDLGDVDATCEVSVNGSEPQVLLCSPYHLDITHLLRSGENRIDVLVYSSLANHYSTIPSPYRGTPRAGLIGPVSLRFER